MLRWLLPLLAAVLAFSGCGSGGKKGASPEGSITEFSAKGESIDSSFAAIHEQARSRPAALRDAALEHMEDTDPSTRFAAVYALSLTPAPGKPVAALIDLLDSKDLDERLLAASSLASEGEKRALPTLIDALDMRQALAFRDPEEEAWSFARRVLLQYTDQDLGLVGRKVGPAKAAAAKPRWKQWWSAKSGALRFVGGYFRSAG